MNKEIKVVVVDDNEVVLSSVKKYFNNSELINIVGTFNNGKVALDYLINNSSEYDLAILDILLPQIDGIKILQEMKNNNINKKTMILSSFKDDYTIRRLQSYGVSYYMLKPIDLDILNGRILDLFDESEKVKYSNDSTIEVEVSSILHNLGIPSHVKGYKYIREGIMLLYSSEDSMHLITKEIYPEIALKFNTTSSRVERAIRHAIEISWIRGDLKLMENIFGNSIDFERSRPTNSEFLTTIADRLKLKNRQFVG